MASDILDGTRHIDSNYWRHITVNKGYDEVMTKEEREYKEHMHLHELKIAFNDIVMRELGLDVDDDDHIVDLDAEAVYTIKEKFLKYSDDPYPRLMANEIDFNMLFNPKLFELLFGIWVQRRAASKGIELTSFYQSVLQGTNKGFFVVNYVVGQQPMENKSEVFLNESLRIFNLICKLNGTEHLYKSHIDQFDIEIPRREEKK